MVPHPPYLRVAIFVRSMHSSRIIIFTFRCVELNFPFLPTPLTPLTPHTHYLLLLGVRVKLAVPCRILPSPSSSSSYPNSESFGFVSLSRLISQCPFRTSQVNFPSLSTAACLGELVIRGRRLVGGGSEASPFFCSPPPRMQYL